MKIRLNAVCCCNTGLVRKNNEDNFYFADEILVPNNNGLMHTLSDNSLTEPAICYAVFDGMGGHADGQIASFLAANSFADNCAELEDCSLTEDFFKNAIVHMNRMVCEESENLENNMGTTIVALGFQGEHVFVCNVGDSRAYRYRDSHLLQISYDHVHHSSEYAHRKAPLTQCIGIPEDELLIKPYLAEDCVKVGDLYLLCSDGITDMLSDEHLATILSESHSMKECAELLIDSALANGGRDNSTLILIEVEQLDM